MLVRRALALISLSLLVASLPGSAGGAQNATKVAVLRVEGMT